MKTITLSFYLVVSVLTLGQEPMVAIELTELHILYRGYDNKIRVSVSNSDDVDILVKGSNCSILKTNHPGKFIVRPGSGKSAFISVSLIKDVDTNVLYKTQYRVQNLPDPVLYWGSAKSGHKASIHSRVMQAMYPPEVPLNHNFTVQKWTFYCDFSDTISGIGSNLSEIETVLMKISSETTVRFEVIILGEDGIARKLEGSWKVDAWTEPEKNPSAKGCG